MAKLKTLDDLKKLKAELQSKVQLREKGDNPDNHVQIKVAMATCGITAGAKEIMEYLIQSCEKNQVDAILTQTGCMGFCHSEPTVEVIVPGKEALVFGNVDTAKVDEIIKKYILTGEIPTGTLQKNFDSVEHN